MCMGLLGSVIPAVQTSAIISRFRSSYVERPACGETRLSLAALSCISCAGSGTIF